MIKLISFLALALLVSFICSILEAVLLSTSLPYINSLNDTDDKVKKLLIKLKTNIDRPIAAILTINTIAHTVGAAGVGAESAKLFGEQYMFLISGILTLLILYLSEIIPKTIGAIYWKTLSKPAAYFINILIYSTYPFTVLAEYTTRIFAKKQKIFVTREELLANALMSEVAGEINESESDIIENTLELSKSKVENILTPRTVVFALEKNTKIKDATQQIENLRTFSRIPIYDGDIDHVVGKVLSKEILWMNNENEDALLDDIKTDIFSIHENIPISKTLSLMISHKEHLFLVKDSYGQTVGVVSMEDCFETLLGKEIVDESDQVEDLQEWAKEKLKNKSEEN